MAKKFYLRDRVFHYTEQGGSYSDTVGYSPGTEKIELYGEVEAVDDKDPSVVHVRERTTGKVVKIYSRFFITEEQYLDSKVK